MQLPHLRRAAFSVALLALALMPPAAQSEPRISLARTVPAAHNVRSAQAMGRVSAGKIIPLAISLPLRNQNDLTDLLKRLYDPNDALYRHYLTQPQFAARFAPTQNDYDTVIAFARSQGLTVTGIYKTRTVLAVSGTSAAVEATFHTSLESYRMSDGRIAHANLSAPSIPKSLASHIVGVVGLNTMDQRRRPHRRALPNNTLRGMIAANPAAVGHIGTGPAGGLAPADIKKAYSLTSVAPVDLTGLTGHGQQLGLYELDGYALSDIQAYVKQFNLTTPTLINVLYQGFSGAPSATDGSTEVVLDIDMMLALAPNATITVYETAIDNPTAETLYQKMADDNIAKSISTSWGLTEDDAQLSGIIPVETQAFKQMATQGQSFYAAAGDDGAYDNQRAFGVNATLSVDDPAANPFVTGVGGTKLTIDAATSAYVSERTWGDPNEADLLSPLGGGGGGGVSTIFAIPFYQSNISGASATFRNVPDVSFDADPASGYDISKGGNFFTEGGTSAAAPLWAAFTGLVNEQRAKFDAASTLGFANPILYNIYQDGNYTTDFHDIADGSTNLFYPAKKGYDNATGLGTFVGDQLLGDLSPALTVPVTLTGTVTDADTGAAATSATITITNTLIPGFQSNPTYDATTGTFTVSLPSFLSSDLTGGTPRALTYSVAADAAGRAGDTKNVTLTQTQTVALTLSSPQHTFDTNTLEMVSAPYDYTATGDFAALFGLTPPLSGTGFNLISYSPVLGRYLYYPAAPADTFHPGQGYWARFPDPAYLRRRGKLVPATPFRITLQTGWNQIGDPFTNKVTISTIQVADPTTATNTTPTVLPISQTGLVQFPLYRYDASAGYVKVNVGDTLQPWVGYWIYANQPAVLILPNS